MWDRYSSWPFVVHMPSGWRPLFLYLHMNRFLCYLALIITIQSGGLRYYDFLVTSSSVFLWWFRQHAPLISPLLWLNFCATCDFGAALCTVEFHMPANALDLLLLTSSLYLYPNSSWYILYYFWLAPYISTQAQVGVSSCLIFLWYLRSWL